MMCCNKKIHSILTHLFRNTEFTKGSVISLVKASNFFEHQEEMILMDGDVLYHHDIFQRLVNSKKKNCFLLDRNIEEGEEPVKKEGKDPKK